MNAFFFPCSHTSRQMQLAAPRGTKITLITAGLSDVKIVKLVERDLYFLLLHYDINVYEYRHSILQAKLGIWDNKWLTLGSFNINDMSNYASVELNLDVRNKLFVTKVVDELNQLIWEDCWSMTVQSFNQK